MSIEKIKWMRNKYQKINRYVLGYNVFHISVYNHTCTYESFTIEIDFTNNFDKNIEEAKNKLWK